MFQRSPIILVLALALHACGTDTTDAPDQNQLSVTITASVTAGETPLTVDFIATATGGVSGYVYAWDFGDNSPYGGGDTVSHTYTLPGSYTALVAVSDSLGTGASTTVVVTTVVSAMCGDSAALRGDALSDGTQVINGVSLATSTSIATILGDLAGHDAQLLQIEGDVIGVCQSKGCWTTLHDAGGQSLNLKVTDGFIDFRTYTGEGRYMVGEGIFTRSGEHGGPELVIQSHGAMVGTVICP